uniref:Uncharacterized protein LOC117352381 n=1 Tax=Geotrypetes seraphini TaxID=260995 RepID=A0A6P8P676_GEOSA|nr:uncharacterized protein LOC117352381 [Geotrypetes seraphini]
MPKRRGKGASSAPRRPGSASSGNIEDLLRRMQGVMGTSVVPPAGTLLGNGLEASLRAHEISLSPDTRIPPPNPRATSSPGVGSQPEVGVSSPPEAAGNGEMNIDSGSQGLQQSLSVFEDTTTLGLTPIQEGRRGEVPVAGEPNIQLLNLQTVDLVKPQEVTMGALWDLIANLTRTVNSNHLQIEGKIKTQEKEVLQIKQDLGESKLDIQCIKDQLKSSKLLQDTLIKDNINLRRKIETFENFSRNNNLRLINFPRISTVTPREMLKRYLLEILEVSEDSLPPFTQVYYLPSKNKDLQEKTQGPIDVSALLELSDKEIAVPATLIVTLAITLDKNWLLRLFFKNKEKKFLDLKIQMFPDLARDTQRRRKEFLLLKPGVLALGGTFYLRHPCKCIVQYNSQKYVFFEPNQLTALLSMSRLEKGKE